MTQSRRRTLSSLRTASKLTRNGVIDNRRYATLAGELLDANDRRLAWLWHRGGRQKVLEELGRIAVIDQASCRECAIELCANPPKTTHAGAAHLRRLRLGKRPQPEKSDQFEVLLHMALAEFLDERPDTPRRMLKATVRQFAGDLDELVGLLDPAS
jgi:hypothetical protein